MHRRSLFLLLIAVLAVEIASCGGHSTPPPVTVTVFAGSQTVPAGKSASFTATVANNANQSVTWAVVGGAANGTINSAGIYTAPASVPNPPAVTVTATAQADPAATGQASITVTVGVTVFPGSAALQTLGTAQFSASVQGSSNQSVTWQVDGVPGGNLTVGTITSGGFYQAPESVPVNASIGKTVTVSIQAVPQASTTISASAIVTVTSINQLGEATPVELGSSGGNADDLTSTECASGTLGALVVRAGTQYILSNNHVLARSDAASLGEPIIQPGLVDAPNPCVAGSGTTTVAHLTQFVNLEQTNPPADAAIAQIVAGTVDTSGAILELGDTGNANSLPPVEAPASTLLPVSSLKPNITAVAKSGRSTGLTCSTILATGLDVSVQYERGLGGTKFTATFQNQIAVNGGTFSAAGDSGSLIVSQAGAQPVALLFAGSSTNSVGAPAATVLASLPDANNNIPTFVGPATRNAVAGCTSSGADAFSAIGSSNSAAGRAATKPSAAQMAQAEAVKNQNAANLLSDSAVLAVGVERSLDRPDRAAIVIFVQKGQPLVRPLPCSLSEIPTRIIAVDSLPKAGALDHKSTAGLLKTVGVPAADAAAGPTPAQLAAARVVKDKYSAALMKQPGILGVGVTASLDDPSEPAILVFVEVGKRHNPIPLEVGGFRVRLKRSDKFRAFGWGHPRHL